MSLSAIKNQVTSKVGRQVLVTQKHSPTLLFAAGIVGFGATVVLACRATLKMDEVLQEAEENSKKIDEAKALGSENYTEDEHQKDHALNRVKTAGKIVKIYAPAALVGAMSIGSFTGAHFILSRRNVALAAAYAVVDGGFKEYRKRVVDELGTEKDREFRFGTVDREVAVDTDDGVAVKTVKVIDPKGFTDGKSMYARIFDEGNRNWNPQWTYNQIFIQAQQNYANDLLKANGHLFLNDVYKMLGFEPTKAGQIVGWAKGKGDNYVDFGIADTYDGQRFIFGDERSVLLDFNVAGNVLDLIERV